MSATAEFKAAFPSTVGEGLGRLRVLFAQAGVDNPSGDAEVLLCAVLGWDRARLHAYPEVVLSKEPAFRLARMAARRMRREPVAYILGDREFWSLPFRVNPDVLIPRPETELLVERAVVFLREVAESKILDVGAGSGAVGVAIAHELLCSRVTATDVSRAAVALANENAWRNYVGGRYACHEADLFNGLPEGETFDVVVSNPPYIRSDVIDGLMPEVSHYEPRLALDGGPDGMCFLREIARRAPVYLRSGGCLLLEMDPEQVPLCIIELRRTGAYLEPAVCKDLAGRDRVLEAVRV